MPCQQRAKRRCPRGSSDVLEADPAPPAHALELIPDILRGVIRVSLMRMIEACLSPGVDTAYWLKRSLFMRNYQSPLSGWSVR